MADQASGLAPAELYEPPKHRRRSHLPTPVWLALLLVAALGGCYVGRYVLADQAVFGTLGGKTTLAEDQLDEVVATYTLDGARHTVTAREALAHESSLDAARTADGSYVMPSAESVLSVVRTAVLMHEVEQRGITVSDEEYVGWVEATFGTTNAEELASAYNMDVETVRARLHESAAMAKLREEVAPSAGDEPTPPAAPEDGSLDARSADYAAYIIALAGSEWDADKGIWASEDGPYAQALREFDVRADGATYEAAQTAYDLAYQLQSAQATAASTQWTEFVNGLLCTTDVALSSVVS